MDLRFAALSIPEMAVAGMSANLRNAGRFRENQKTLLVLYHIPEDNDDPDTPNAFRLPLLAENFVADGSDPSMEIEKCAFPGPPYIRLKDVKARFPLPGTYYYRFKVKYEDTFVWLDVENDENFVPLLNGKIVLKASRIGWGNIERKSLTPSIEGAAFPAPERTLEKKAVPISSLRDQATSNSLNDDPFFTFGGPAPGSLPTSDRESVDMLLLNQGSSRTSTPDCAASLHFVQPTTVCSGQGSKSDPGTAGRPDPRGSAVSVSGNNTVMGLEDFLG